MNQDEGFWKRWEFRRSNADVDSSSDDEPSNEIVLFEKEEEDGDDPRSHINGNVRVEEKKLKSIKRKKVTKKKKKKKQSFEHEVMLKDLKMFGYSLVRELASAKESMLARMRDEMRELVASELAKKKKKRKKVCGKIGSSNIENTNVNLMNGPSSSSSSRVEFCNLIANLKQQQLLGGFSVNYNKTWGLYGESRPSVAGVGLGAPLSLEMVNGSNQSSLSLLTEKDAVIRALSQPMIPDNIISSVSRFV